MMGLGAMIGQSFENFIGQTASADQLNCFSKAYQQQQNQLAAQVMSQVDDNLRSYHERVLEEKLYKRDRELKEKVGAAERERAFQYDQLCKREEKMEKKSVNSMKSYIEKHRDVLYTICLALVVDHFVLNGAIRHRIQRLIEAMLAKVEGMLGVEKETVDVTP